MAERLREAFKTGRWALDWWEGDPRRECNDLLIAYYVRPAMKGYEGETLHAGWTGECTHLTKRGCELEHDTRPLGCRGLKPKASVNGRCIVQYGSKEDMCIAWIPYHGVLVRAGLIDLDVERTA